MPQDHIPAAPLNAASTSNTAPLQSQPDDAGSPPPGSKSHSTFLHVLVNTAAANVITSFLWFALTFWVYLETRSVLATGLVGGVYMLLVSVFGLFFGVLVDRYKKHAVMVFSALATLVFFALAMVMFTVLPASVLLDLSRPWYWVFALVVLLGAVIEQLRNIALSTTVTLLVPADKRAQANGLVGSVQGLTFLVTSVFSGLAIGMLGMAGTLLVALVATVVMFLHLLTIRIPEAVVVRGAGSTTLGELRQGVAAVRATQGLVALIIFTTFNNLTGGVYMALMDPYGLTLFSVEMWGVVLGVTATGFIVGGGIVAKYGLGRRPLRTMLIVVAFTGLLGAVFTLREWWWLYAAGIWLFMILMPAVEAAEQTIIQQVVPAKTQGRVFGLAMTVESAATPITAFAIAPLAEFWLIPYMETSSGQRSWGWLLGSGDARGMALVFLISGVASVAIALAALCTRQYRELSKVYDDAARAELASPGP